VFRNGQTHSGVLLIRSQAESLEENASNALAAIGQYGTELRNHFSVLSNRSLRIRKTLF
jgi:hypothetical protein